MKAYFLKVILLLPTLALAGEPSLKDFPEALQKSIFYEQKLIGIRDLSKDTLDSQYQPENGKIFEVPTFWVNRDLYVIKIDDASIPPEIKKILFRTFEGKEQILVSVHPDGSDYFPEIISQAQKGKPFIATASASPRSLITVARDQGFEIGFYNKLSLNKRLGGNIRLIHKRELARSYFVTKLLSQATHLPESFGFYPEFLVMIPKGQELGGTILRSIPREVQTGQVTHIPFFALYAPKPDGSKPIILKMAEKVGVPVDAYFTNQMIKPFLHEWMDMAIDQGITMEPHGQNLLLEVDSRGLPTGRFFHRDFGGFTVDTEYRKQLGLYVPELPEINGYQVHYGRGDIEYGYKTSLDLYFAHIVSSFGHQYESWFEKKWVKKPLKEADFHRQLIENVEKAYFEKTGNPVNLKGWLANLVEPMFTGRNKVHPLNLCRSLLNRD